MLLFTQSKMVSESHLLFALDASGKATCAMMMMIMGEKSTRICGTTKKKNAQKEQSEKMRRPHFCDC